MREGRGGEGREGGREGFDLIPLSGAYSESRGIKVVREHVAEFITKRDGFPCTYDNIYLLNGASEGIKTMLFIIMDSSSHHNKKTGILIPRPQYPLYSAAIAQLDAAKVCEGFIPGLLAGGGGEYWYHGAYEEM